MGTDSSEHPVDAERDDSAAIAERDAKVEQLERAIEEEREHSASLRSTVNELRFQAEILEKSYSKQLEDARVRAEAAEHIADEQRARVAELDSAREDAIELLTDAKAEIDRLESDRNKLRRQLASEDGWQIDDPAGTDDSAEGGTINALMNDAKWVREKAPSAEEQSKADAETRAAEEAVEEEMISPELVLSAKAADS